MAEAVRMAMTSADSLLGKLAGALYSSISSKLSLLLSVREEIEYIKDELEMMNAVLMWAEEQQETDLVARAWVKQLRELAYDANDCIDEFTLHLTRSSIHNFKAALLQKVRGSGSLRVRHRIAEEIQNIKKRVEEASKRRLRYSLTEPVKASTSISSTQFDPRMAPLFIDNRQLVGLEGPRDELTKWLLEEKPQHCVISVLGEGGLGKTTLAKKVYESPDVSSGHFSSRVWITVSQSFDIDQLLREMIKQLLATAPDDLYKKNRGQLTQELNSELRNKRYLIVFDDIWKLDAWYCLNLALPIDSPGSKIMVTTRIEVVANTCSAATRDHVYRILPLTDEESLDLFSKRVFGGPKDTCPLDLQDLTKDILRKCHGLPLAIVTIAGLLASKPKKTPVEWQTILNFLGSELESNPSLEGMKRVLTLSYNDLPYHLKNCYLYLSIFPEDYLINRHRLERLWIAEGFARANRGKTAEEVAESYFNELINRCMILPSKISVNGKVKSFRVHDIVLEVIVSKSAEMNLVSLLREHDTLNSGDTIRRLSVHANSSQENTLQNMGLSHLRMLVMFGKVSPSFTIATRLLRVLDLEGCRGLKYKHLKKIGNMIHLRYISLRGAYISSDRLPKSWRKLHQLETLDLRESRVRTIPFCMKKFQNMRCILGSSLKFQSPRGFGSLENLQKLGSIEIRGAPGRRVLKELAKLTKVTKLGVRMTDENVEDFWTVLDNNNNMRRYLRSLKVELCPKYAPLTLLDSLSSPTLRLEKLKLRWVGSISNVIHTAQALPNLIKLRVISHFEDAELPVSFPGQGFKSLKLLELSGNRLIVTFEEGSLPRLESLHIMKSKKSGISGIKRLTNLKEINFHGCGEEDWVKNLKKELEKHHGHSRLIIKSSS